jgi:hypothetical protein
VLENPFTYGNAISDPGRFFGRAREAEQIFGRLRNPEFESSSIVGDRRVGKTSLLNHVSHPEIRARNGLGGDNYAYVYIDLQIVGPEMGPEQLWRHLLSSLLGQCRDDVIAGDLKELLERGRPLDSFDLDAFFRKADTRGLHTVFLLDEFDQITTNPNFGPDFYFGFRSLAIHRKVALITSSRLELVQLCHSEAVRSSPFFNIFANINLRVFSPAGAATLVSQSLARTSICFTGPEAELIGRIAGRHPFFLQMACFQLYEAYRLELDAGERQAFLADQFQAQSDSHFVDLWDNSTDPHKIVLTAAALLESRAGASPQFSRRDLLRVYSQAEPSIAALERRGLIMRTDADYRLFSSALGPWIVGRIAAELDDRQKYPDWLAQHQEARAQVRGWRKKRLREVLPKVGSRYRHLVLAWASDPESLAAMARLLQTVLGVMH